MTTAVNTGCRWCGMIHGDKCPSVKAIEYFCDGTVKRVEFMTPADYFQPTYPAPQPYPYPQPLTPLPITWGSTVSMTHVASGDCYNSRTH